MPAKLAPRSAGRWGTDIRRDIEAPVLVAAAGLSRRVNLGAGVPIYHIQDSSGLTQSGVGDVSVFAKVGLIDPATNDRHVGVALTPLVEIAGPAPTDGTSRVNWAVPISLEARATRSRVYGSAGYFSAGAVFGTGALEVTVNPHFLLTATVGESYATRVVDVTAGVGRHRTDVSMGAAMLVKPTVSLFVAVGHSFSGDPLVDGGPWIAGGVAFRFARR